MLEDVRRIRLPLPVRGVELALLEWGGDGPLALLHHANGFCGALWAPVAERLRPHYRVVALDARGHGDSSRPDGAGAFRWAHFGRDALAVAEELTAGGGRVALGLGHSFGGTALALAAIQRPDLFERLVLLDPIVVPGSAVEPAEVRRARVRGLADGARQRRHVWESRAEARARWAEKDMFAGWTQRALDLYLAEGLRDRPDGRVELKCPGEVEAAIFESGDSVDLMAAAPRLETPTLVLWASRGSFPRAHFEELAGRMQRGRVRDADTGHLVPMEDPELVAREALAFGRVSRNGHVAQPRP